ncbi:MAG: hypothetical protein CMO12_00215 [Thaumarchaeota archaeon]|jgi:hypothetical protein|nr:hypothetical protein [Nitrososphaerota archaeon]|tara:strand:+ start:348 stop:650 length:303 start_codon:yes stop_codon:yes gene_type:complete
MIYDKHGQEQLPISIENGLGSKGRLKILRAMTRNPHDSFTRYQLQQSTRLNATGVKADLNTLIRVGWVKEYPFEPRKYQIELENPIVSQIVEFFKHIGYI